MTKKQKKINSAIVQARKLLEMLKQIKRVVD